MPRKSVPREEKAKHVANVSKHLSDPTMWVVFVDGSSIRNPGPAGSGAVLVLTKPDGKKASQGEMKTLTRDHMFTARTSNNVAELKGFELGLDLLAERHVLEPRPRWIVMTDSQYVRGLFELGHVARANIEIVAALRDKIGTLAAEHKVTIKLEWVRAHCGIHFNELADQLANAASSNSQRHIQIYGDGNTKSANKKRRQPDVVVLRRVKTKD